MGACAGYRQERLERKNEPLCGGGEKSGGQYGRRGYD